MNKSILILVAILILILNTQGSLNSVWSQGLSKRSLPQDRVLEQRAASLARLGRTDAAVDLYLEILYKNPTNISLYFRVSNLMPGKEKAAVLLQILDDILQRQPQNNRLLAEKGRILYSLDRKTAALTVWQEIVEVNPRDRMRYTSVSNAMLQAGATREAIDLLISGRQAINDPQLFAFELARIYTVTHNYDLASEEYLSHLDNNPGMLNHISNQLIRMLENEGALESIIENINRVQALPGDHQSIALAHAKLLLHEKRYDECVEAILASDVKRSLRQVMDIANDLMGEQAWRPAAELFLYISANTSDERQMGEALLNLASTYMHRLDHEPEYTSLSGYFSGNQFLDLDVRMPTQQDISLKQTLTLYDSLQTLLPATPEAFKASYHIAELQLRVNGDVDRAIRGFQHVFSKAPQREIRLEGGLGLVDAWLVKGDTSAALRSVDALMDQLGLDEDDPVVIGASIKVRIHEGDIPAIKKALLNLSGAATPSDPIFNDALELMALIDGNGSEDDPELKQYLKAEKLVGQHKLSQALEVLAEIKGEASTIADEAHVRAIQILLALGDETRANERLDAFLIRYRESPWRAHVLVWKGEELQFRQSDPEAAIPFYEEVIINHSDFLGIQELRFRLRTLLGDGS